MIQYLMWRCIVKKHISCSIHFMVGHTRFSPDQYFGMIKRKYRKTRISSIGQLAKVVTESTQTGLNHVQLAFDPDSGYRVPCFNWKQYLSRFFKTIPLITKYHHFCIRSENPGVVELKEFVNSPTVLVNISKPGSDICSTDMPETINPPGIPLDRQKYLFEQIHMFCEPEYADITCPEPTIQNVTNGSTGSIATQGCSLPKPKRVRVCSYCKCPGHTKSIRGKITCPKLQDT